MVCVCNAVQMEVWLQLRASSFIYRHIYAYSSLHTHLDAHLQTVMYRKMHTHTTADTVAHASPLDIE